MTAARLSVVVPMHDEAATVDELISRVRDAATPLGPWELVIVNDASTDDTGPRVIAWTDRAPVRHVRLRTSRGQFGATRVGLHAATGERVVVLDGDLQDPPEVLTELVRAADAQPDVDVVYATKRSRGEDPVFRLARAAYGEAVRIVSGGALPDGAGSCCLLSREVVGRVLLAPVRNANLAAVVAGLDPRFATVAYDKAPRADGRSRVGWAGLVAEGVGSLWTLARARAGNRLF